MKIILPFFILSLLFTQSIFSQNTLNNAGLTSSTPSSVAFSLRKLSSSYSGFAIKVRRSSDNAEANVAFDGTGAVSAASLVTFTPGVVVAATLGTAQTGTISSSIGKTGTLTITPNRTGTLTLLNTSTTVTGAGTNFTTEIVAGDHLFNTANNLFLGVVASVTNNTTLLLNNFATATLSAISYKTANARVAGTGTNFTGELTSGDRLFTTANIYLGTVTAITSASSLTLNAIDAIAATAINYNGASATVTGVGTNFTGLSPGDLLISNNTTLGIISSVSSATSLTLTTRSGASVTGLAFKSTPGTVAFSTFYAGTSNYVNTWYDQSGNSVDAIQLKPANQARIVNAGAPHTTGGKISMEFSVSLVSSLETQTAASYLNNTPYTLNTVTAESTTNPANQFPLSTTGGSGPTNTLSHFGYRSSSLLTIAQLSHDLTFNATPTTSLESHTGVKATAASGQFYKNGVNLGIASNGVASYLFNVGLLNIGYFMPTNTSYNGSIDELIIFPSALGSTDVALLDNNQLTYYNIPAISWTGAVSTDWTNTGNWSTGVVPGISAPSIVLIPAGKPFYPVINAATVQANSISIDAGASLTISGAGILQLAGTINNLGACTATTGTVQYMGSSSQGIAANTFAGNAVNNLVINNSAGVILDGNLSVTGNLTFTTGKLAISSFILTIGGTVTNTVAGGLTAGSNASLVINGTASPSLSFDQTTAGTTNILRNLTINSAGQTATLTNNLTLLASGTTLFTAGKLAIGTTTLSIRGPIVNTVSGGLTGSVSGNLVIDGTVSPTLSFDQTVPGTTNVLGSLTVSCSGQTATLSNSLIVGSALNLTSGVLADGGNQLVSTGALNLTGGTFKLGSATVATTWPAFTTNTISATGTAEYAAGVAQTVSSVPIYQDLTISAAGGTTAGGDLTVNNVLNLSAANPSGTLGSLAMSSFTLNMGALATTIGQGDVTGIVRRTTILPNISYTMGNQFSYIIFPNTGTLPSQMSMKIAIGATPAWQPGAIRRVYDFIQTGGSGTKAVITAHYLDTELNGNIESNLVDYSYQFAGPVLTENGKSDFSTIQNWIALSNVNVAFFSSTFGNIQLSLEKSSLTTLTWNGSTSTSWITATNWTPNGGPSTNTVLIIPDAATTLNSPSLPATASNGSVTIQNGGIVNSDPGAQLTLNNTGLAWSNLGTFNAGTSTIIFTNPNASLNGTTNFNNVTINTGAGLQVSSNDTMRIAGTMVNNGSWFPGLLTNTVEYNGNNQSILVPGASSYSSLIISGTGTTVFPAAAFNVSGDLTINGVISTSGNTLGMNGVHPQTINGSAPLTLNNLVINNASAIVSMNQNLAIANTLTFTAGKLALGPHTLTLSGNVVNTILNGITGSLNSNLIVNGAVSPTLSFDQTSPALSNALNNFTINSGGQIPLLGSDLSINGTITFTAGKLSLNGNTLRLKGSIVNTVAGGLRGGSSSNLVILTTAVNPVLSFDQSTAGTTNLLNNLTMNSAGQTAALAGPLVVGGALGLTHGCLITTAGNSLALAAAATVTGGSDSSFVSGPLLRNTNATTGFVFPIGKANIYRPVTVTPVSSTAGLYNAEYFPAATPAGSLAPGLTGIATNEYWDISRTSGPDAAVTLIYTAGNTWSPGSPNSGDNIFVAHLNGSSWESVNAIPTGGHTGIGMTPVTSMPLASFSPFTFGFGPNLTLPVTLVNFKATRNEQAIQLLWTTADESSLAAFDVQRSADGVSFYVIGSLPATNTHFVKTYNWPDNNPLLPTNFYRLKMIDLDGNFKYSIILKVDLNSRKGISVYPNPVAGNTLLLQMVGQPRGTYILDLYNTQGEKVMSRQITHDGNDAVRTVGLNRTWTKGLYYLVVIGPDTSSLTIRLFMN